MTDYEEWRLWLAVGQILATLASPFVIIKLTQREHK